MSEWYSNKNFTRIYRIISIPIFCIYQKVNILYHIYKLKVGCIKTFSILIMWLSSLDKWEYFIAIWMCINIEWMHFYLSKRRLNFCRICNQFVKRCVIGFLLISYISCSMNVHMIWTYIILLEMLTSASGENLIDFQWNAEKCKAYFMRGPYLQIIRACYEKQKICEAINSNYIS